MQAIATGLRSTSDGWRAIIADTFTFENVRRLGWAIGSYLQGQRATPRVLIAHDTRFMGELFAQVMIETLSAQGVECALATCPVPTPVLSWYTYYEQFDLGLMITASHNPPHYNGVKIRVPAGGPPDQALIQAIEKLLPQELPPIQRQAHATERVNLWNPYVAAMRELIDLGAIDRAGLKVAVDAMHGVTAGLLHAILSDTSVQIVQVRGTPDPLFGGQAPEPKGTTIKPLIAAVKEHGCVVGFAHDGDGDRIVGVDPERGYISPHDILTLLAYDLAERRGLPGSIIGSVSITRRARAVADLLRRPYHEVPIGFRNASERMRTEQVLVAGEENGGIGVGLHFAERDGTLAAALLLELIACRGGTLGICLALVEQQIGTTAFLRRDIAVAGSAGQIVEEFARQAPAQLGTLPVVKRSAIDGIKLFLSNKAWILARAAGTEPLIRVYAEADDEQMCTTLIGSVAEQLGG